MEHISNILTHAIPNATIAQNNLLDLLVKDAIAASQIRSDILPYAVRWHIPANKYTHQAKSFIEDLTQPAGGYNATFSDGNWLNPVDKTWVPEPIVLVKSFMTIDVLQRNLAAMLRISYRMGQELGESAIALEILNNSMMLIIPTD